MYARIHRRQAGWLAAASAAAIAISALAVDSTIAQGPTAETGDQSGYASFARTTLIARRAELEPSIVFWRDVMGFSYAGDPTPVASTSSDTLGWSNATRYFTSFSSEGGSTLALLMIEDDPDFPTMAMPAHGAAYGGVVLVHTARNIGEVYARALAFGVGIVRACAPSETGRSLQMMLRAPTGHMVEVYEMIAPSQQAAAAGGCGMDSTEQG